MISAKLKKEIIKELPSILKQDKEFKDYLVKLLQEDFANKEKTEDRIDRVLDELRIDRELNEKKWQDQKKQWQDQAKQWQEQAKKWEANEKKWETNEKKWEANEKKWEANEKRWEAWEKKWESNEKKWETNEKRWEANEKRWEENQKVINKILDEISYLNRRYDQGIGAIGARWGFQSEQSFRNGIRGILEDYFELQVINYNNYDEHGEVFGEPDQIEIDVIIKNGLIILCELKSSMSKADTQLFLKKARFYEKHEAKKANSLIVISPMVDPKAVAFAKKHDIKVYTYVEDADPQIFQK